MESAKVSVIIPVFNIEKYLKRCLDSILTQTMLPSEIILVDDGSKDACPQICDEYASKYGIIKVIHKCNEGLGYARNSGLDNANGEYIVFVDGDDYLMPTRLENLYKCMKNNEADSCIAGFTRVFDSTQVKKANPLSNRNFQGRDIVEQILPRMMGSKFDGSDSIDMSACVGMLSNSIIQDNNIRFPSEREWISEDMVFDTFYYPHAKKVCISDDVGYCYCDNGGSLTTKYRNDRFEKQVALYNYLVNRSQQLQIFDLCKERLITTLVAIARYSIKLEVQHASENGNEMCMRNIQVICDNEVLNEVWNEFDNKKVPLKSRIVNQMIIKKYIILLFVAMKLKIKFEI